MVKKLLKEIVIPAGTIFYEIPAGFKAEYGTRNFCLVLGLTKDSSGTLIYGVDPGDTALDEWFGELGSDVAR